jgi:hypothetical protein
MGEKDVDKVNIAVCDCTNGEVTLYWKVQLVLGTEEEWVAERHNISNCSWATFKSVREVIL